MYMVTGGAGFIGSNIVHALNEQGHRDILVVDDLTDGRKFANLRDCAIADYLDIAEFERLLASDASLASLAGVFHQGACSDTTVTDGREMLLSNFSFSKRLLNWTLRRQVPFVYASSAAVYGGNRETEEVSDYELPLNVYGYSKTLFDQYVRNRCSEPGSTVAGLRYFNVYGPRESHKGKMASMVYQLYRQIADRGTGRLFKGSGGAGDGEQRRDFVHVRDVVNTNLFFMNGEPRRGIYNVGTGRAHSFNEVAQVILDVVGHGHIEYIPFPESLRGNTRTSRGRISPPSNRPAIQWSSSAWTMGCVPRFMRGGRRGRPKEAPQWPNCPRILSPESMGGGHSVVRDPVANRGS
jgi:ADP-L-glycero-D-manno-heptose 6-epimerase